MTRRRLLWIGSYTPDSGIAGHAAGVQRVWFDTDTAALSKAELAAPASGPSFRRPRHGPDDGLRRQRARRGTGHRLRSPRHPAAHRGRQRHHRRLLPRHRAVPPRWATPDRRQLRGRQRERACPRPGRRPHCTSAAVDPHRGGPPAPTGRKCPHAHSVYVAPGGTHLLVVDLGTDELRCFPFAPEADQPAGPQHIAARLEPGSGPRHLAIRPPRDP